MNRQLFILLVLWIPHLAAEPLVQPESTVGFPPPPATKAADPSAANPAIRAATDPALGSPVASAVAQTSAPVIPFDKPIRFFDSETAVHQAATVDNINDFRFIYQYYKTIESSLNRNRKTGKLGKKSIEGLKSGFFHYRCRLTGWNKVTVTMVYEDYCDLDYIINGTVVVQTNWSADGFMTGTLYATGPTPAAVGYDLVITDGVESDGFYLVDRPQNTYAVQIPSAVLLSFAHRDIQLDDRCTLP